MINRYNLTSTKWIYQKASMKTKGFCDWIFRSYRLPERLPAQSSPGQTGLCTSSSASLSSMRMYDDDSNNMIIRSPFGHLGYLIKNISPASRVQSLWVDIIQGNYASWSRSGRKRVKSYVFTYVVDVNTSHTPEDHRPIWPTGLILSSSSSSQRRGFQGFSWGDGV